MWILLGLGLFGSLRVMEGLCNQEGVQEDDNVYLFSLSGSVLVLSLVKINRDCGGEGGLVFTMPCNTQVT